ncbi:sigma 54-interacting transcriptional regulator [Planomicrobium chinense]|nr:sigma 54-interacting transcriptional regulator [Planococcus chinensis]
MSVFLIDTEGESYEAKIEKGEKIGFKDAKRLARLLVGEQHESISELSEHTIFHTQKLRGDFALTTKLDAGQLELFIKASRIYKSIEDELKSILDSTGELVTIVNNQGVVERVSSNCKQIMGIEAADFVGNSIFELERTGVVSLSSTKRVLETHREVTVTQVTKGGRRLYVNGFPLFNDNGTLEKILNISRDVTEESILRERLKKTEREVELLSQEVNKGFENSKIIMKSVQIEEIYYLLSRIAKTDATVLFLGETGVGKGVFARHLHNISERRKAPFINVNCSVLPEHLIESELFGYVKGSFTGASTQGKKGLIEAAHNGTLFLDEIGELPLQTQAKLLQVLQDKSFMPIGKTSAIKVDIRIIAATNQNLEEMVEKGQFRSDLYYRLNVVPITIPPLRERREDVPFFLQHFLDAFNANYKRSCRFTMEAIEQLSHYDWPGNVRELQNMVERLVITSPKQSIDFEDLPIPLKRGEASDERADLPDDSLKVRLDSYEKEILLDTLKKTKKLHEMSQILKIDASTISRKLKKHHLNLQ